mmetsp:Transcript_36049/g.35025  ORF Transcript_36049/g.35025 Transcript_36049/m.35025 type:complete len:234 (-) Transcript_36049:89-790(-)
MELLVHDLGLGVAEGPQERVEDPVGVGGDAPRHPRVDVVVRNLGLELELHDPSEGGGEGGRVVYGGHGVQTDEQVRVPQLGRVGAQVVDQVVHIPLLTPLDRDHAPGMLLLGDLASLDGCDRREEGVAVVAAPSPVELPVLDHRLPRVRRPALPHRLLVQVPIQQHRVGCVLDRLLAVEGFHLDDDERALARVLEDFDGRAHQGLLGEEVLHVLGLLGQVLIGLPVRVIHRRE